MFHTWEVKIANTAADSSPKVDPGKRAMNPVTVTDRKPRIGTDCRMSSAGRITFSARGSRAAAVATTKVNTSDAARAANIRSSERSA